MHKIVAIGGSFGAMEVLLKIVAALPPNFPATLFVVTHIGERASALAGILDKVSQVPVRDARDGEAVSPGVVLLAPADWHMLVCEDGASIRLHRGPKENYTRPAIDPLFRSVAVAFGKRAIGVLLTGYLDDGVAGLHAIKSMGGLAFVQDPADAAASSMPTLAIENVAVDMVMAAGDIGDQLIKVVNGDGSTVSTAVEEAMQASPDASDGRAATAHAHVTLESRMSAGAIGIPELASIATPSTFTCPECHGTLWQIRGGRIKRFRCHTGHAYTARILQALQTDAVEEALWAALRAMQEREQMLRDLETNSAADEQRKYAEQIAIVTAQLGKLRDLLAALPAAAGPDDFS